MIETRSAERLKYHFEVERKLARTLKEASKSERTGLYSIIYNKLFQLVPDHPQLTRIVATGEREAQISRQLQLLGPFLRGVDRFVEIGAGDCALSIEVARNGISCVAVDVSSELLEKADCPPNVRTALSGGTDLPVESSSIDLVYSNQLMEHLHEDDALEQLESIVDVLKPGGSYICITPSRLSGPHDISGFFTEIAEGLHLKEYSIADLSNILFDAGFSSVSCIVQVKGRVMLLPLAVGKFVEILLSGLPRHVGKKLARSRVFEAFLGVRLIGYK